ncbi:toxin-antitoxin system YwqK family antitoxin [Chryseolinea soli]|uniref:Toxin-antitoxin system YwqK family antitoxin n=1 Tax=Chryseolinea soli TaxID=2321403 RepID=A0A385STV5_9BACT|nr:toxin-antitoxin system YwqK family antitoxin [Chryseolinea soli]AYB34302.1 toxin-antitoxin system YwqK family antitoxin [Chryseolinea soli]
MKISQRYILSILIAQTTIIGCARKEEVSYYPNGVVKSRVEIFDGKPQGIYRYFYPSGKLAIQGSQKAGRKNGMEEAFYESGSLKQSCEWKDNMRNGSLKKYNEKGDLLSIAFFRNDIKVDREDWYYFNGKIITRQLFDSLGNVIYIMNWDSLGRKIYSRAVPVIKIKNDSINVNEDCLISIRFGFQLTGEINFDFESLESADAPQIELERDSLKNIFLFKLKFQHPGKQEFLIMPRHVPVPGDTLSADGCGDKVFLFVKPQARV